MDCREKAKTLIDELHPDDLERIIPLLERLTELRETLDILSDPDALKEIQVAQHEFAKGKVIALEEV